MELERKGIKYWGMRTMILERNKLEYKYCYIENGVNNKLGHTFNILYPESEESKKLNNEMLEYLIKY
jgi:hypothetical protein